MKMKAGTSIVFVSDGVAIFGQRQKVQVTRSGHYAISLNISQDILKIFGGM